ncbi:DUF4340 domain-containing protein [Desulfomonile tiedjei]|uniref:DUF4340 domain-containing protein n=1 Tax=Desulfomonile tiedjei (strain ATCC 49306 / DSM 6799 / DCB-1) TaxID=706587 RepID=I4C7W1_DESTA|nr:DUF4340 domain-containing protein [Desulfomonile tiedjei]AFM25652.1 hypothetical protein Desti_2984 [Desulfomonile tiedjei DSM 6799]
MKLRNLAIYAVILAALAAYVYFVEIKYKTEKQQQEDQAAKLIHLDKDKIVRIELKSPDQVIELKKPGDSWVLSAPVKTAGDQFAIGALVQSALDAKPERVISEKDVKWEEYGLEKPEFILTLETPEKKAQIDFGAGNPSKSSFYARVEGQPKLLLVADTLKNSLNKKVFDLREKSIFSIAPNDVDRVVISKEGQTIELERESPDKWNLTKPEKFKAKLSVMESGLNSITALKAKDIIDEPNTDGDTYGFENPQETIHLSGAKLAQTLIVGKPKQDPKESQAPGSTSVYAKLKDQPMIYVIEERALKSLKTDPKDLRDRSVMALNPSDIEKIEVAVDGKTWLLVQKDKKWSMEQPEKKENLDSWVVSGLLWALKDLEWKSTLPSTDPAATLLEKPQLVASFYRKNEKDPIVFKAAWEESKSTPENKPDEKKGEAAAAQPDTGDIKTPETVNVSVSPSPEQNTIFKIDGGFIDRMRGDLLRISEKK